MSNKMTRSEYKALTGDDPIEMWGSDWENILADKNFEMLFDTQEQREEFNNRRGE